MNWSASDYMVAGLFLVVGASLVWLIMNKATTTKKRLIWLAAVGVLLALAWAELAVGLFNTPFSGS